MNIMVFDVAAEHGGALTILNDFYNFVVEHPDKNINWYFIVSRVNLENQNNIRVIRYPWIKKSWFHRIYFDKLISPLLISRYNIKNVISLQNTMINTNKFQTVYLHQSIPFSQYKFKFKSEKTLWIYQNIISKIIYRTIKKADRIVVQTIWMKQACLDKVCVNDNKIKVIPPEVSIPEGKKCSISKFKSNSFFYPAFSASYKNQLCIVEACIALEQRGITDYEVVFTISTDDNEYSKMLYEKIKQHKLKIKLVGKLCKDKIFEFYSNSVLIFPSFVETFGLPMLECKLCEGVIIASDCLFSHEILDNYENAYFFNQNNSYSLSEIMEKFINGKNTLFDVKAEGKKNRNPWSELVNIVIETNY